MTCRYHPDESLVEMLTGVPVCRECQREVLRKVADRRIRLGAAAQRVLNDSDPKEPMTRS